MSEQQHPDTLEAEATNLDHPAAPHLVLQQISSIPSGIEGKIEAVQYWGEYTIVIAGKTVAAGERKSLLVYNQHGEKVEDFEAIGNLLTEYRPARILLDLCRHPDNLLNKSARENPSGIRICDDFDGKMVLGTGRYETFELPPHFSALFVGHSYKRGTFVLLDSFGFMELIDKPSLDDPKPFLVCNDRYLMIVNAKRPKQFIAYDTAPTNGQAEHPRNWQRYDNSYPLELPEEIAANLQRIETEICATERRAINSMQRTAVVVMPDQLKFVLEPAGGGAETTLHGERIAGVNDNVCVEEQKIVYFCRTESPTGIWMLDTSAPRIQWQSREARFPRKYARIEGLTLDPSNNFFIFHDGAAHVMLAKSDLSEIGRLTGLSHVSFLPDGTMRAVDEKNNMVVYQTNLQNLVRQQKARAKLSRLDEISAGLFQGVKGPELPQQGKADQSAPEDDFSYLDERRRTYSQNIIPAIDGLASLDQLEGLERDLQELENRLASADLTSPEVKYLIGDITESLCRRRQELVAIRVEEIIAEIEPQSRTEQATLDDVIELSQKADLLENLKGQLDEPEKAKQLTAIITAVRKKTTEIYRQQVDQIKKDVGDVVKHAEAELRGMDNKMDFDDWVEYSLPQLKARLARIAGECPLSVRELHEVLIGARERLTALAAEYGKNFKEQYAKIREEAATKFERTAILLESEIESLFERARSRHFQTRLEAEQYLEGSPAYLQTFDEIKTLSGNDPERANRLLRDLKVKKAVFLNEIERGSNLRIKETGQQIVTFGRTEFPVWEAPVKERQKQKVELSFQVEEKSKGPGISPAELYGDVSVRVTDSQGKTRQIRLFEEHPDEDDWRYGNLSYRGRDLPVSYLRQKDFRELKKLFVDWSRGQQSALRAELQRKREAMRAAYRELLALRHGNGDAEAPSTALQNSPEAGAYRSAFEAYASFIEENKIILLRQIERLQNMPEAAETNGKGYVPKWQSHWVLDHQTEKYLEQMAESFEMQTELQEGMLLLKGHAGTGKDVLMKMFCERTRRPYFAYDCTKWTTEADLSEDIELDSQDGAPKTIRVPSTVLLAVQTPGAVLYFNEFNAMPEVAQIFLHALMDEKRAMTLKTRSGKTVRATPSLLIAASMNPNYPGTYEPQMATRSRTVPLIIDYPELWREPSPEDGNRNKLLDASEALRIARSTRSLQDLTYEPNMQRNEFVKVWDKYVNGLDTGAPELSERQKFDLESILAIVVFGQKLRQNFMLKFEKTAESRKALPVTQPFTLREVRRCAYVLGRMKDVERSATNPEQSARQLIEKFFLCHFDKEDDKRAIRTAMATWSSQKRIAL